MQHIYIIIFFVFLFQIYGKTQLEHSTVGSLNKQTNFRHILLYICQVPAGQIRVLIVCCRCCSSSSLRIRISISISRCCIGCCGWCCRCRHWRWHCGACSGAATGCCMAPVIAGGEGAGAGTEMRSKGSSSGIMRSGIVTQST